MAITKKMRFEVLKRDSFTCQYCGQKAPAVVLEVDHIDPRARGGDDDIMNLVTACFDCNRGKSDRHLSDDVVVERRRQQVEDIQKRKEQLEMMFEWQEALRDLSGMTVDRLHAIWRAYVPDFSLSGAGLAELEKLAKKFEPSEIAEAIKIAADAYLVWEDGTITQESAETAWKRVGGICQNRRVDPTDTRKKLYYVRGILRKRLTYCDDRKALLLLMQAAKYVPLAALEDFAKEVRNWTEWRAALEAVIDSEGHTPLSGGE